MISAAAAILGGVLVRQLIQGTWKFSREGQPPLNPNRDDAGWKQAIGFAAATGIAVGLARLGARVFADAVWKREHGMLSSFRSGRLSR